jgi:hypothetical protein
MASLAEIRAKLLEAENNKGGNRKGGGDNAIYAFWNIPENSTATIRFLPDGNTANDFFWLERQMIRIPFSGVKGGDESRAVTVNVPCVEMWGQECPIHKEIRPWFKDPSMEDMARKYWKKRSYLFQGFVNESPFAEDSTPENPVRRFIINSSIYKIISSALMDPDFGENLPTDFDMGTDFRITKTQKGQYADYSTSNWARKERSLDQAERDAIATHGLHDLNDFMPKKPDEASLNAIFEMFESSVEGELYDPERFADYYRPYGVDAPSSTSGARPAEAEAEAPAAAEAKAPAAAEAPAEAPAAAPAADTGSGKDAKDILAAIRARKDA